MPSNRKFRSRKSGNRIRDRHPRKQNVAPRTAAQYNAKSDKFKNTWGRVVSVVSKMRSEKTSLQKAAQEQGISPRTVKGWARSALQKQSNGKWVAKKSDNLLRVLTILGPEGKREIGVRGSRKATELAEYWNTVHKYLETGDASRLAKFQGKYIKAANGENILFITDRTTLNRLGSAGVRFESLYSRSA